ncbi:MAG: TIR domain-containing protein, partial [Candidatus Lokiarchaeota archaeon]|nr:TIR domain-containing protein [Candidatus Lokiarchaeota archaeon]
MLNVGTKNMNDKNHKWDLFISHASEDQKRFVRPLSKALDSLGVSVWYAEFSLSPGDSLSKSIDKGLSGSRFGLVILSKYFINKAWPQYELRGLVAREIEEDKVIIPVWLGITKEEVLKFSPTLADKVAIGTDNSSALDVAIQVLKIVRPDLYKKHPRSQLEKIANGEALKEMQIELNKIQIELNDAKKELSEFQCPYCGAPVIGMIPAPADPEQDHW